MARGGSRRRPRKLGAEAVWAILRSGGDWHAVATRGKWPLEMFADYLSASIAALFELYENGRINYEDALRNADSVNDLRLEIKLKGKESKDRDLTASIAHLDIV